MSVLSVGWVIKEDDRTVILVPSLADVNGRLDCSAGMSVPKAAIIARRNL